MRLSKHIPQGSDLLLIGFVSNFLFEIDNTFFFALPAIMLLSYTLGKIFQK